MTNDEVKIVLDGLHDVQRVNSLSPDVFDDHADVYEPLFDAIIVDRLFKHFGIKPLHNATIFNGFAYDEAQGWVATFYWFRVAGRELVALATRWMPKSDAF